MLFQVAPIQNASQPINSQGCYILWEGELGDLRRVIEVSTIDVTDAVHPQYSITIPIQICGNKYHYYFNIAQL